MKLRRLLGALCLCALFTTSGAAMAGSAVPNWTVDASKSTLGFTGQQSGVPFTGHFKIWTASISFDPAHPETAQVLAIVNVASAATGDEQKDEAMPSGDWFDVSKFATATFQARGFMPKGGDAYETRGQVTLRGITKEIDLPFTLTLDGSNAHVVGQAKIVRTDFGVGQGAWASGDTVALEVLVDLDLVAKEQN